MSHPDRERTRERRARLRELRAKLAALRASLRAALAAKKARMRELTATIRAERAALRDRLRAARRQRLVELRERARAERQAARAEWQRRRAEALREATSDIERARVELAATRERAAEERRIVAKARSEARAHAQRTDAAGSDEAVRAAIPSALVPVFDQVKDAIRSPRGTSRVEAFLRHAETYPDVTFRFSEPAAHAHIEATRDAIADVERAVARGRGVADYEARRARRIERLHAKAARLDAAAHHVRAHAEQIGSMIPLGQPMTYAQCPSFRRGR
jgi:hypothetical protein